MAAFNRFEIFSEELAKGSHQFHAAGHTFKAYLSNTAPDVTTDAVVGDLAEIAAGFGYAAGGEDTQQDISRAGLVTSVTGTDIVWTAVGGSIGPFQYAVLYNTTGSKLVGYWNYGSAVTLAAGETFTLDFGASQLTIG